MHDDRYHHLYDHAPVALFTADRAGKVIACNPATTGLLGRGRSELVSSPILKWLAAEQRDAARAGFLRALEDGRAEWDSVIRRADGSLRPVRMHAIRHALDNGAHLDVFVHERSIERAVRVADAAVLDLLVNMPGVYAFVCDSDLRIRHACGMSRTHWCADLDVIGRELVSLLVPSESNARRLEALRRDLARGESWAGTLEHARVDGSTFPAHGPDDRACERRARPAQQFIRCERHGSGARHWCAASRRSSRPWPARRRRRSGWRHR